MQCIMNKSEDMKLFRRFNQITDVHIRTIHGELTKNGYFAGQYRNHDVKVTSVPNSKYCDFYPPHENSFS